MPDPHATQDRVPVVKWGPKEWDSFIDAMQDEGAKRETARLRRRVEGWEAVHYQLELPSGQVVAGIPLEWVTDFLGESDA